MRSVPDSVTFAQIPVSGSGTRPLTLINQGPAVFIDTVLTFGAFDLPANPVTAAALFLDVADSLTFAVRFSPSIAGDDSSGLQVEMTDPLRLPIPGLVVSLRGTGTDVVIDEVLADPGSGLSGDANGDGTRQTYADEFVELFNRGSEAVDLAGWRLGDDDAALANWFEFPPLSIVAPGGRMVLFGGGSPQGFADPTLIFSDDGRIGDGLSNSGDGLFLIDADGDTASIVPSGISWNRNQSVTRYPPGAGPFAQHSDPPGVGSDLYSPGAGRTVVDSIRLSPADTTVVVGQQFDLRWAIHWSDGDVDTTADLEWQTSSAMIAQVDDAGSLAAVGPGDVTVHGTYLTVTSTLHALRVAPEPPGARCVVISEVLADPPSGSSGDANGDGERLTYADEFVELFNPGPDTVSIAGWTLGADDTDADDLFHFPAEARLPPRGYILLFGGGTPQGFDPQPPSDLVRVFVDDGRIGNGLTNSGDGIILRHTLGDTIDLYAGEDWPRGRSLNRWPEDCKPADLAVPCPFVPHDSGGGDRLSPGVGRVPPVLVPPQFLSQPQLTAREGRPYRYDIELTSDDGDITLSLDAGPAWLRLDSLVLAGLAPAIAAGDSGNPWPSTFPVTLRATGDGGASVQSYAVSVGASPHLAVTEILADPPAGPGGDANGDGVSDRYEDEFVEIHNRGRALDLSHWRLSDDDTSPSRQFAFPPGTVLLPEQHLTLFGGGKPALVGAVAFADDGRIGNGLTNSGDRILLIAVSPPDTIIDVSYRSRPNIDESLTLVADGEWGPHSDLPGRGRMSPGVARPVYGSFIVDTLEVRIGTTFPAPAVHGIAPDGEAELIATDLITWVSYDRRIVTFEEGNRTPVALAPGTARIAAWRNRLPLAEGIVRVRRQRNQPPSIISAPDTLAFRGGNYRYQVKAVDAEGDELRYAISLAPEWLKIERTSGLVHAAIPDSAREVVPVLLKVAERSGRSVEQRFALRVIDKPRIRIAEILSDPPVGPEGDANGNGKRETYGDEFVEIQSMEETDVDIGGWLLSSGDVPQSRQFRFPDGTVIAAGARAVLFGANAPPGENSFSDDGRIGVGLGNRSEDLFLVAPSGPDTIDRVSISLRREPNQSLSLPEASDLPPILHGSFPGRGLYSPGKMRPTLTSARISPARLTLLQGDGQRLSVVATFSDGLRSSVRAVASWIDDGEKAQPQWQTTDALVVAVNGDGNAVGNGIGEARVTATLGPLHLDAVTIEVRERLEDRLRFSPRWSQMEVRQDREIVLAVDGALTRGDRLAWFANGRGLEQHGRRLAVVPAAILGVAGSTADTISVRVTSSSPAHVISPRAETVWREWILTVNSAPVILSPADTSAVVGTPFEMKVRVLDADGDRLYFLLARGPAGMRIDRSSGVLTWLPVAGEASSVDLVIRIWDAGHAVTYSPTLRIEQAVAKELDLATTPSAREEHLAVRCYPNPSGDTTTIGLFLQRAPLQLAAEVRIYDVTGQPVQDGLHIDLSAGWCEVEWDGRDDDGHPVAAGVYLFELRTDQWRFGTSPLVGKILRLD